MTVEWHPPEPGDPEDEGYLKAKRELEAAERGRCEYDNCEVWTNPETGERMMSFGEVACYCTFGRWTRTWDRIVRFLRRKPQTHQMRWVE